LRLSSTVSTKASEFSLLQCRSRSMMGFYGFVEEIEGILRECRGEWVQRGRRGLLSRGASGVWPESLGHRTSANRSSRHLPSWIFYQFHLSRSLSLHHLGQGRAGQFLNFKIINLNLKFSLISKIWRNLTKQISKKIRICTEK